MFNINNVINNEKKTLLAYKEKLLSDIQYTDRSIDNFRANHKNKCYYDDYADSSDCEDDFASAINKMGPSIQQLELQHTRMKNCLLATKELTNLMVLQSEVNVLVEDPKFEGECPVTEAGTWREVTVECRIDLVHFTMTFFMHTPVRKFAPPSYRGVRVVPVKSAHELELSKSVLKSLKVPSDAVEVLRSYAEEHRSRRTTLARLANKYTSALFMEPHAEGGFVLKCADLLEVSWRLENKRSPVAPFHHKMKFDLEYMEESYIKIIKQAHKQLSDPAIQTDERTLLLAKIITTCLEARGIIDPESDLESKTTERDNYIDKRDSESEKRDSEVMAPPKSLPKKGKQRKKESLPSTAQKRSTDDENGDSRAKKMKNDASEAKKSIVDANNIKKSKMNGVVNEGGKKRKINEVNRVANSKNLKEAGNIEDDNVKSKEIHKEDTKDVQNKGSAINNTVTEPNNTGKVKNNLNKAEVITTKEPNNPEDINQNENHVKTKNKGKDKNNVNKVEVITTKEPNNPEDINQNENNVKTKNIKKKKLKKVANTKSKENIDVNKDAGRPKSNITENNTNAVKNIEKSVNNPKTTGAIKVKNVANTNIDDQTTKKTPEININVASTKNDGHAKKATEKSIKLKEKQTEVANKGSIKDKIGNTNVKNDAQTVKKVTEKNSTNMRHKDKISKITKVTEKNVIDKPAPIKYVPEKVLNSNLITKKTKENTNKKNIIRKPIAHKIASHRNSLKPQNPPKVLKAGNTKTITTGNTEKENGGKGSKIPQKTLSNITEGSSKKNPLRISPRKIPSEFKTTSRDTFKQKVVKSTNIPRLLKKTNPKTNSL